MKKNKLKLYESVINKHKKLEKILWVITYFLGLPFAILQILADLFDKIASFGADVRSSIVYGLLRTILKKELQEVSKNDKNLLNDED